MRRIKRRIDGAMAAAGLVFMDVLEAFNRSYRRPLANAALRLGFAFHLLVAVSMLGWLAWDWSHGRQLDAAEDAVFDQVITWRPFEPPHSGRVVVVEIDDCSIEYFRSRGEGGWPWSRERHADLIDALDRAGASLVGFDILFADPGPDPDADAMLDLMAQAGSGRFRFASARLHPEFDDRATLTADLAPGAWPLRPDAMTPGPGVAVMLPYGEAMRGYSGLVNVARADDGVVRDVRVFETIADWAIPSLPLQLARQAGANMVHERQGEIRINWRSRSRISYASAADLISGRAVCHPAEAMPPLDGAIVLVGHTAAGINDVKPTPVNAATPGVEVLAEAVDAMLTDTAIAMPPAWLKYLLAGLLVLLTTLVFWRGEPHEDVDTIFVTGNLALLLAAFSGLTFLGVFLDIFASVGYGAMCFGLCRGYCALQRGRSIGNTDYMPPFNAAATPWMATARLRFVADPALEHDASRRRRREYRRLLRRFVYRERSIVMIEGVVERKSWLHAILDDLVQLVWRAESRDAVLACVQRDLHHLHTRLNAHNGLDDGTQVLVCLSVACIGSDNNITRQRLRLRGLFGQDFNRLEEWPLSATNSHVDPDPPPEGERP